MSIHALVLNSVFAWSMFAQVYNVPLTMEGLNHTTNASIASKAMGGVTLTLQRDVSLMYSNPAGLTTLDGLTVSASAIRNWTNADQAQQWTPINAYGNFSLLMDGSLVGVRASGAPHATPPRTFSGDTLWVPNDDIGSNWTHARDAKLLPNLFVGLPLTVAGVKIAAGVGYAEYANMDYFYQNNNDLAPEYDLLGIGEGKAVGDSVRRIDWMQTMRKREGSLHSIGGAISAALWDNFSVGVSARMIGGSTDDVDGVRGRSVLWFYSSGGATKYLLVNAACMRMDTAVYSQTVSGTSEFDGYDVAMSSVYRGRNITVGIGVTLPTTMTRKFSGRVVSDTAKTKLFSAASRATDVMYSTDIALPMHGSIGIGIQLRKNVSASAEVEYLPYNSAEMTNGATRAKTKPWLTGTAVHVGMAWDLVENASLYFGYRRANEVYQAQYSAYAGDPISYIAYSVGAGVDLMQGLRVTAAYEFYKRKYEDVWSDNANVNTLTSNTVSASVSYAIDRIVRAH